MRILLALALLVGCERADKSDDPGGTGLPRVCRDYLRTLDRYVACPNLPAESRKALGDVVARTKANWATIPKDANEPPAVAQACKDGDAAIKRAMAAFKCP